LRSQPLLLELAQFMQLRQRLSMQEQCIERRQLQGPWIWCLQQRMLELFGGYQRIPVYYQLL